MSLNGNMNSALPNEAQETKYEAITQGDFNQWNENVEPMKRLKNGDFTQTVELSTNNDYAFRYILDNGSWENDWEADSYRRSPISNEDNSVVSV